MTTSGGVVRGDPARARNRTGTSGVFRGPCSHPSHRRALDAVEVIISPEDDAEIRRLSIATTGCACMAGVTSYLVVRAAWGQISRIRHSPICSYRQVRGRSSWRTGNVGRQASIPQTGWHMCSR